MSTSRRSGLLALVLLVLAALLSVAVWLALSDPEPASETAPPPTAQDTRPSRQSPPPRRHDPPPRSRVEVPDAASTLPSGRLDPDDIPETFDAPPTGKPLVRTIEVTVLREDGGPAADARVVPFSNFGSVHAFPEDAHTDREGHATLLVTGQPNFRLRAWTDDAAVIGERLATMPGESEPVTLQLTRGRRIAGRVESEDGRPIDGARVVLRLATDDPFGLTLASESANDGKFDLGTVPLTTLDAGPATLEASARGHAPLSEPLAAISDTSEVVLRMQRGQSVRGRFVGLGNAPVAGVAIAVRGQTTTSGDDGTFELTGLPADGARLLFETRTHVTPPFHDLPAGQGDVDLGDIVLDRGLSVSGTVVDGTGTPIPGASVLAAHPEIGIVKSTSTDENGAFTLPAIGVGAHAIAVAAPDDGTDWSSRRARTVDGVTAGTTGLRIQLTGALSVVVTFRMESDRSEVRVAAAEVTTARTDVAGGEMRSAWSGPGMTSVRVQLQEMGTYDVTVEVPGYETAVIRGVTVAPDREVLIDALFRVKPE